MYNCMSTFKLTWRNGLLLILLTIIHSTSCSHSAAGGVAGYNIMPANDEVSRKWARFFYDELCRRAGTKEIFSLNQSRKKYKTIHVAVNNSFEKDITIEHLPEEHLTLKAKNEESIAWLVYQVLKQIADNDSRIDGSDLLPPLIGDKNYSFNFDFSYREPYWHPNLIDEKYSSMIATHSLEREWGIWGHNLARVLRKDKDNQIYARDGDKVITDQFCFSGQEIFSQLKTYIIDNFGYGDDYKQRFMIMPQDNNIVCNCSSCRSAGNTPGNATPAVYHLVKKLATHFPGHMFFTSAYLTTSQPYHCDLPPNTGVMMSTIELPKGIALEKRKETRHFLNTLHIWKSCTPTIYIWDYAANFDDYLTPLPVLYGLKKQLQFYKSQGIQGIFLNACGYDYSPFEDLKTYVTSALMINSRLDVDTLCCNYFDAVYPVSGKELARYYLSLEKRFAALNSPYSIYGGFREALRLYLNKQEFVGFYEKLPTLIAKAGKEEKEKLSKLYTALSYTRLQLAYHDADGTYGFARADHKTFYPKPEIKPILEQLSGYTQYDDLQKYKETGGQLSSYLGRWNEIAQHLPYTNLLLGQRLQVFSKLDADYSDIRMLTDGVYGFQEDYHQGWLINSAETLEVGFGTTDLKKAARLSLRFLVNNRHRIKLPQRVDIYKDDVLYKSLVPTLTGKSAETGTATVSADLILPDTDFITLKIIRGKDESGTIACDEITLN